MSSRLRPRRGRVYGARASRQKGRSLPGPKLGAAPIAAAASRVLLAPLPSSERRHRRASRSGLRGGPSRAAHAGRRAGRKLNKGSQRQPPLRWGDE